MSITIEINSQHLEKCAPLEVHYLPAKIDSDGDGGLVDVDNYFNNYTQQEGDGLLSNSLRGFPLYGKEMTVPSGYKALVLQETQKPMDEKAQRKLKVSGSFPKFCYWNYDKVPSKADGYSRALQLLSVSDELAKSITEEDVLEELKRGRANQVNKNEDC